MSFVVFFVSAIFLLPLLHFGHDVVEDTVHRLLVNVSGARICSHDT